MSLARRAYLHPTLYRLAALRRQLITSTPSNPAPNYLRNRTRIASTMAPIPQTMRAVVVEKTGGPEVLEYRTDYPIPAPKQGQVLIKNKFAGINYIDTYFRTGLYPSTKPEILGREASGIVASLGSGPNKLGFKEGERVVFMSNGAYAEYSAIPAENVVRIPDGVSDEDAVGGYLMGMTALSLVRESYPVKKGDTVLLHAAAGGVGLLMCQILKGLGAKTIGTAGGAEKIALAKQNGADEVIDYKAERDGRWLEKVKQLTNGEGVDVVYDSVGKDTWEGSLDAVKRKGSVIFYGNSSGPVPPFPVA